MVSCGCFFAIPAKFRGKIYLANEVIVYVDALNTVAAGLIGSMDNDFLHKLPQKGRGQLGGLGVLFYNLQKALDIDRLRSGGVYDRGQILYGLFQRRLLLSVALGQLGNDILSYAVLAGMEPVIPPKKNRKEQRDYDKYLYKLRHLVENCFLSLKRWRGIATRSAKTSDAFIAAVHVRCIAIWGAICV